MSEHASTATSEPEDCGCGLGDGCQWDGEVPQVEYDIVPPRQERTIRTVAAQVRRKNGRNRDADQ